MDPTIHTASFESKDEYHKSTIAKPTHSNQNPAITAGGNFNIFTNTGAEQVICNYKNINTHRIHLKDTQYNRKATVSTYCYYQAVITASGNLVKITIQ
jgi:hypothetical protein